jgi:hypothetical protein
MDENWPDWSNFRHIILTWYKEPYKTKKLKKMISQIGLKSTYSQFPSNLQGPARAGLYRVPHNYPVILGANKKPFFNNR